MTPAMVRFLAGTAVLVTSAAALAQPVPASPAARPRGEPAAQTSTPSAAPPASTTQTTGTPARDPTVKEMNSSEKAKVDAKGK